MKKPAHRFVVPAAVMLLAAALVSCEDEKTKTALAEAEDRLVATQKTLLRLENEIRIEKEQTEKNVHDLQTQNNDLQKSSADIRGQFVTLEDNVRKAKTELEAYKAANPLGQ